MVSLSTDTCPVCGGKVKPGMMALHKLVWHKGQ